MNAVALASQRKALDLLMEQITGHQKAIRIAQIRGPSGCGKSWMLRILAKKWADCGDVPVIAAGEAALSARSYSAFWIGISAAGSTLSLRQTLIRGAGSTSQSVPFVGSLLSFLTDLLADNQKRLKRDSALFLRNEEFDILAHLRALTGRRKLLLIADDLQYWDQDSLQLLHMILSGRLDAVFPFLAEVSIVVSITDSLLDQPTLPTTNICNALPEPICIGRISIDELAEALHIFGLTSPLEQKQLDMLHALTGGHLELLRQLVEYLHSRDIVDISELLGNARNSADNFLATMLVQRLRTGTQSGDDLLPVLEAAAIIGTHFASEELSCLLKSKHADVVWRIEAAQVLGLVAKIGSGFMFRHEVIRKCLIRNSDSRAQHMHRTFANCLSLLRPFDYLTRAEQYDECGCAEEAARLLFCGYYKRLRDGNPIPQDFEDSIYMQLRTTSQEQSARQIVTAYRLVINRQFQAAIGALEASENTDHPLFIAERLLLLGLATLQSVTTADRRKAYAILQRCVAIKHCEKELDIRIKLTLLTACVHLELWDEARRLDLELSALLSSIQRTDPGAAEALAMHRRKSGMLYGAEVAAERCRLAISYFGPPYGCEWPPRNPVQLFMAQCNLAGNMLVAGRFEDAATAANTGLSIWSRLSYVTMPRTEKCINNSVLGGYLVNSLSAKDAAVLLQELRQQNPGGVFSLLIRGNCAALQALSGEVEAALAEYIHLSMELDEGFIEDEFYRYFIRSNLAGLMHIVGKSAEGLKLWRTLDGYVPRIPESDRQYLLDRQKYQVAAFSDVATGNVLAWDTYLQSKFPEHLGPGWKFYGRGLLLTDTQIWLES